jgi:hypothetical protein
MNTAFDLRHQWRCEWRDLAEQFKALRDPPDPRLFLYAIHLGGGHWAVAGGPTDKTERNYLQSEFRLLGTHAGVCAGAGFRANALDFWLNSLVGDGKTPPYIREVILRSAERCQKFAVSARPVAGVTPTRLRRDSYPEWSWLYDHSHEPLADPKAEYDYWTAHIWRGYSALIDNYVFLGISSSPNRHEKLNSAIDGLSYDLAVLQANYVVDRGLLGEAMTRAFWGEATDLLNFKVIASWRASCERLSITSEDQTKDGRDLAQSFQRVRDDLQQLLPNLPPPASGPVEPTESTGAESARAELMQCAGEIAAKGWVTGATQRLPVEGSKRAVEVGFEKTGPSSGMEPSRNEPTKTAVGPAMNDENHGTDRRKAVDAYIEEVFSRTGKRITRTDIWKSLRYKSRAEFERWESRWYEKAGKTPNATANRRFTNFLVEKPHLK